MDIVKKARTRVTSREWWTIRTQRKKRIIQAIVVCSIVVCAIIVSVSISSDHEKPSHERPFNPDYMLGPDELVMNTHYNKRWRPNFITEPQSKPSSSAPLSWEEIESTLKWYHQKHKPTPMSTATTTTTTTETTTTDTTVAMTTTIPVTTTTSTTTTTTTTIRPPSSSTLTTQGVTEVVTTEKIINNEHIFKHNETGTHSEVDDLSPPNATSLLIKTTESYDSVATGEDYYELNGFNQTTETVLVTPEAITEINPTIQSSTQKISTPEHFEISTETTWSFEENPRLNENQNSNNTNLVHNQSHTEWIDDGENLPNISNVSSQGFEKSTLSITDEVITTPVPTRSIPKIFHVNASMKISSNIGSETIGSAERHHHSNPKPTAQATAITEPSVTTAFNYPQPNICLEDECFIVARKLNQSIDQHIGPCENFYQHVCGNQNQIVRSSSDHIDLRGTILSLNIKEDIKDLLIQEPLQYDSKAVKNVKNLYRACVRRVRNTRVSLLYLQKALSRLTSFIRKSKTNMKGPDLGKLASHVISLHANYLFPIGVVKDSKNVSRNVLHIGINKLLLLTKKNYESRLPYFNALRDLITEIANIMGVRSIVHKVLGFELLLSQITPEDPANFESEYNPTTIGELETTTHIAWSQIFQSALDLTGENIRIGLNETVIVQSKEYLKKLLELLKDTDESDLIDYILIRFVLPKLDAMPEEFYELSQRYQKVISGIEGENRQLSCVLFAGNMMPGVVGKIYSDRYFSEAVKYRNIHVPKMIHSTAIDMIRKLEWMDRSTKLEGLKKLYSMLQMIGNDETLSGDPFINQFQFMDDHMKNLFILDKYRTLRTFSQLRTTNSRGKWAINSHPFEMKSFYSPQQNAIYIPAAMFQQPLFHDDLPLTMQFGALGSAVGHAYIHALDIIGSKYDDNGNKNNWWSNKTRTNFHSRLDTLNSHTLQDFSDKDIIESSADIGGVSISWRALKKMQKEFNLVPMVLPGLNYTSDQLFFINYARAWCDEKMMLHAMDTVGLSTELPAKNRVIITLQNMPSFSDAFKCKVGDYMNPKEKTHIW